MSGYKIEYDNGDVLIVEMCKSEHELVIALLQRYFNIPNGNVVTSNPSIIVAGQPDHPSPNADGLVIAPDIAVYPHRRHVPRPDSGPTFLGPPPSDLGGLPHARIICELAISQGIFFKDNLNIRLNYGDREYQLKNGIWDCAKGNNNPTACNAPGIPAYQVNIPINDVFYDPPIPTIGYTPLGAPPPPAIINGNFTIDLYVVQQEVLNSQAT
ncbi:hypothetical protein C2G38_2150895 [Gigaspora rosea]|uniref:Uncharacterized protein n=1 Tax=Gigaspora rosea TaxID=44941 RepID=A0A397TTY6_9GLOM|nr:hypothetical protein C2G38_2150895 [Gigaspora rosea]